MLVMMAGLPGVGKTYVANQIAEALGAVVLSVDSIEDAIIRSGIAASFETGLAAYEVGATIAKPTLERGLIVIADAANYVEPGRRMWRSAAEAASAAVKVIEVVCSDENLHRQRLESRNRGLNALPEPTWDDVVARRAEVEPWACDRLTVDTGRAAEDNLRAVLNYLAEPV